MKLQKILFISILLCGAMTTSAEELNLNCVGTFEVTTLPSNQKKNSQAQASFRIDLDTNSFSMDGYPIMSTSLDTNLNTLKFLTSNSTFEFAHKYKDEKVDVLSSIKINRYSGKLEIYEALAKSNGMLVVTAIMDCTTAPKRKF